MILAIANASGVVESNAPSFTDGNLVMASNAVAGGFTQVSQSSLTVSAANITGSHTLPDGVLSANVPLLNAAQTFTASNTYSGGVALTNVANTLAGNGAAITNLNAANIASGTIGTARLGSSTANSSVFLRGDQTWSGNIVTPTGPNNFSAANNFATNVGIAQTTITNGISQPVLSTNITAHDTVTNFYNDCAKGGKQYFDMTTVGVDVNWTAVTNQINATNYQEIGYTFKGDGTHKMTFSYPASTQPWTPTNSLATNGWIPASKIYKMAISFEEVSGLYTNIAYVVTPPNQ